MTESQPIRPANILKIVAINQGRLPLTMEEPAAPALSPDEAHRRLGEDSQLKLVDTRESAAFGASHPSGAINVQLSIPAFEQRIGWILGVDTPFILLTEDENDAKSAVHKLAFLGIDSRVAGFVAGGMPAWKSASLPTDELPQVSVQELHDNLAGGNADPWRVIDAREGEEWSEGHIAGGVHMNFKAMGEGAEHFPFSRDETLALICASGLRSSTGASLLQLHGFRSVLNVTGGMNAWRKAGFGVTRDG